MKPFLILQLRPETAAADDEFAAILAKGGLDADQVTRVRLDCQDLPADLDLSTLSGVIVGGGPGCVSDPADKKTRVEARIESAVLGLMPEICATDTPFLGCCYGMGILGHHLGGTVSQERYGEPVGAVTCTRRGDDPLLDGLPDSFRAFVGHKEAVQATPPGAVQLVTSGPCPVQMIRHKQNVYATQFHPEADSAGFELRIRIYKDKGYFPPDQAEDLIDMCRGETVVWPQHILRNFVARYRAT